MKKLIKTFTLMTLATIFWGCGHLNLSNADKQLDQILQAHWDWSMSEYPEWATYEGHYHNAHLWTDYSLEAHEKRHASNQEFLNRLEKININNLHPNHQLNYRLFKEQLEHSIEGHQYPTHLLVINQMWSFHTQASRLIEVMPKKSHKDIENIIQRLTTIPIVLDQQTALLRQGLSKGITPPKATLAGLGPQLKKFHEQSLTKNPLTHHLFPVSSQMEKKEREDLQLRLEKIFEQKVLPAFIQFSAFIDQEYVPQAIESVGWRELPNGIQWYQHLARNHTTTQLTSQEIHDIGLKEVERIKNEMTLLATQKAKFSDLESYKKHLLSDESYYFKTPQELLVHYQALCKRIDGVVATLFQTMPRTPYAVLDMPATQAPTSPAALYMGGNMKTGRAGQFLVNTSNLKTRPIWESEALALHEALPGHHLQISIAQELEDVPEFRKRSRYTAFVEGWGLYAEALGMELGFYQEPSSDFGRLSFEMWRAVRLVVDTGLHALGWTRQEAIEYFQTHSGRPPREAVIEVDRYIVRPGQALAYKIGEMKIWELRKKAQNELGDQFNVREFHDVVLGQGAVSLLVLEEIINQWIQSKKS